jgi:hypothetical protein
VYTDKTNEGAVPPRNGPLDSWRDVSGYSVAVFMSVFAYLANHSRR